MTPEEFFGAMVADCKITGEFRSLDFPDVAPLVLAFENLNQFRVFMLGAPAVVAALRTCGVISTEDGAGRVTLTVKCSCGMVPIEVPV